MEVLNLDGKYYQEQFSLSYNLLMPFGSLYNGYQIAELTADRKGMESLIAMLSMRTLRIRGGMDNPSASDKDVEIPYLKNINFMWDGFPCIDFLEIVMSPIENGLATITVKGFSLLDACKRVDAGGLRGNPPRATAPRDIIDDSDGRQKKAAACIMNYIKRGCWFYNMARREFAEKGPELLIYMRNFGVLRIPAPIMKSREEAWRHMTMETLRIPYDSAGYFKWMDLVYETGRKMSKSGQLMLDKWVDGLPSWFNAEVSTIRHDTDSSLSHKGTYGAEIPGCLNALLPHPLSGQPHIQRYAYKYYSDWMHHSKTAIKAYKPSPHGRVFSAEQSGECDDIDGVVNYLHWSKCTPSTDCNLCGGKGHGGENKLPDGSMYLCATKVVADSKEKGESSSAPTRRANANEARLLAQSLTASDRMIEMEDQILYLEKALRKARRFKRNTPRTQSRANVATSDHTDDSDDTAFETEDSQDATDATSDESDGSHIEEFADIHYANTRNKRDGKRPMRK